MAFGGSQIRSLGRRALAMVAVAVLTLTFVSVLPAAPASAVVTPVSFSLSSFYPSGGSTPTSIVTADFNKDGKLDIAVSNRTEHSVAVLLHDATTETYGAPTTVSVCAVNPTSIVAADFNNDTWPDVVVACGDEQWMNNYIAILLNSGGSLAAPSFLMLPSPGITTGMVTADLNADGNADLVVAHQATEGTTSVLWGNGAGSFAGQTVTVGHNQDSMAVADFNNDTRLDVIVGNGSFAAFTAVFALEAGGFGPPTSLVPTPWWAPSGMATTDFNNDGNPDLVIVQGSPSWTTAQTVVLFGNGSSGFLSSLGSVALDHGARAFPTCAQLPSHAQDVFAIADFNSDGNPDILAVTKSSCVTVSTGDGAGNATRTDIAMGAGPKAATAADLDGDGDVDAAVATSSGVRILTNTTTLPLGTTTAVSSSMNPSTAGTAVTFTATVAPVSGSETPTGSVTFQADGDDISGCVGLALVAGEASCTTAGLSEGTHGITAIYTSDSASFAGGSGALDPVQQVNPAGPDASVTDASESIIDGNGNGVHSLGVVRVAQGTDNFLWFFQDTSTVVEFGNQAHQDRLVPGDYDGDGKTDPAVYRPGSGASHWYIALTSGGFRDAAFGDADKDDRPVPADYDGDGRTDIAVYRPGSPASTWFVMYSHGGFEQIQFGDDANADGPVPADFDCGGSADVAVRRPTSASPGVPTAFIAMGSSSGVVTEETFGNTGDTYIPGDFDGDGCADVMVVRSESGHRHWYGDLSSRGFFDILWGDDGDSPISGDFNGDGFDDIAVARPDPDHFQLFGRNSVSGALISAPPFGDTPTDQLLNTVGNQGFA